MKSSLCLLSVFFCFYSSSVISCEKSVSESLQANQQKWHGVGWEKYSFVIQRECFCPPEYRQLTRVIVENGKVVSASYIDKDNAAVSEQVLADLYTIEDWFNMINKAVDRNADHLEVVYHATLGFPEKINIDMRKRRADDEQVVLISEVIKE